LDQLLDRANEVFHFALHLRYQLAFANAAMRLLGGPKGKALKRYRRCG
jgi:hypothetical protein